MHLSEIKQLTEWNTQRNEYNKTRLALAVALADDPSIPRDYAKHHPDNRCSQFTIDNIKFWLTIDEHKSRFEIRICTPDVCRAYPSYDVEKQWKAATVEITVSGDKSADQIKKDVERRLLPQSAELYRVYIAAHEANVKRTNDRTALARELHAVIPCAELRGMDGDRTPEIYINTDNPLWGTVQINSDNSCQIEFRSVEPHIAKALLTTLQTLIGKKR
jgi:hypothetical protein